MSLNNLAALHVDMGDFAKALPLKERALAIREKALGPHHPSTAVSLKNLALQHESMGDYAKALPLHERALAIREKALGPDHPDTAVDLNNLAELHEWMGNYAKALPLHERALAIREKALGPDHPDTALSLNKLAGLHDSMGDYPKALPLYERALAIREKALGPDHPDTATSLNNLALLHKSMGDYARALPLHERALAIYEKALGPDHPSTATSLGNLASLHEDMGDYAKALPLYERALAIKEKALGPDHPSTATSLNNLAGLHYATGADARALPLYERALAIREKSLGPEHPSTATSLNNLAGSHESMGDSAKALPLYERAVTLDEKVLGSEHLSTATSLNNLASLHQSMGDYAKALPLYERARTVASHRQKLDELSEQMERLQRELSTRSVAYRQEKARQRRTPEQLAAALPTDAVLVDVLEYDHYTPGSQEKKTTRVWERRLVAFVLRRDQPVVRVDLGAAREIADLIDGWRLTFGAGDAGQQAGVELRQRLWQPLLPHLGEAKTVLVSPDGALCRLPLGALPGKEPGKYLLEEVAITIIPVPRDLPELLAPHEDGALLLVGGVDYDADPAGVPRPANPLARPTTGPGLPTTRPVEPVLAMSRSAARVGDPGASRWDSLPGTKTEARALLSLYAAHHAGTPQELTGAGATERAFREQAQTATYLHLATHGYFADPTVKSALTPATQPAERMLGRERTVSGWHPGLLSGIVLAGANRPADALRSDDGILTALEVSELDLQRVDLAVLSACETGLGQSAGGEGLLGLQRAFQTAGARSVVAGQWKVHDAATAVLMETFYSNLWEKKMPKGEALRQAQLALLNGGATRLKAAATARGLEFADGQQPLDAKNGRLPPYYWAGFVLSGDWR